MAKIAVQLYSVRDQLSVDYEGIVRQIAGMGYDGVEPAGMFGMGVRWAANLFESLSLAVPSAHMRLLDDAESRGRSLDDAAELGCKYVAVPYIPPDQFGSVDQVEAHCERMNNALNAVDAYSMKLLYHNHWWEFTPSDAFGGKRPFDIMKEKLDPRVGFEIDTYWVQHAGQDVAAIIAELGDRAPVIHAKDGHPGTDQAMIAVGDGDMNFTAIKAASKAEWWVVELDRCDSDMLTAVQRSVAYLKQLNP